MKRISRLLFLSVFLASCASTAIPVTATPVMTQTSAPTATLAFTDTPQPTPTETPDPNRPPGATGLDENGNYIKPWMKDGAPVIAENGTQLYETWVSVPIGPNGERFNSWTEPHTKNPTLNGGIPTTEIPEFGYVPVMPIRFFVKDGIQNVKFLDHTLSPNQEGVTYADQTLILLRTRSTGILFSQSTMEQRVQFRLNYPGSLRFDTIDAQGTSHTIDANTSFTIILVDPADIPNPDLFVPSKKRPNYLACTIFDDAANTVTILAASTRPIDTLDDQKFINVILIPLGRVLVYPDLNPDSWRLDPLRAPQATSLATMALKGDPPYFTLSDSP